MEKQEYLELYHEMVLIRRLEETAAELYQKGEIGGFLHLYIGQEAVSTGIMKVKKPQDQVITAYRDHGVALSIGIPAKIVFAELLGKQDGCSNGKGGSMHMADVDKNFFGGHAIVGAQIPMGAGLALSNKMQNLDAVTICMFGEGATNIGFFHEGVNLAKTWELPILWVCENNRYGMGTSPEMASAVSDIIQKACGYRMPAYDVDGMDLIAVMEMISERLDEIRNGSGPQFVEVCTYRYRGHSMGDPERYRSKKEVEKFQEKDPIKQFKKLILDEGIASEDELKEIDEDVEKEIEEGVEFAKESPEPPDEALFEDIYVEEVERG